MLDIARIEIGKLELDRRPVDLRAVVTGTIDARRAQIERRGHFLTVELGDAPIIVEADEVRLAQVVSNLVDNAAEYSPDNGHISVALMREGEEVEIVVSDSGVGIPPEQTAGIFDASLSWRALRSPQPAGSDLDSRL